MRRLSLRLSHFPFYSIIDCRDTCAWKFLENKRSSVINIRGRIYFTRSVISSLKKTPFCLIQWYSVYVIIKPVFFYKLLLFFFFCKISSAKQQQQEQRETRAIWNISLFFCHRIHISVFQPITNVRAFPLASMKSLPWKIKLPPKIETRTPYICIHMLNQQGRIMRVKDDALCVSRRKLQLAASRKKKKKKHARPFEYAIRAKRKKKKRNPETKSNGHRLAGWTPVKAGCKWISEVA